MPGGFRLGNEAVWQPFTRKIVLSPDPLKVHSILSSQKVTAPFKPVHICLKGLFHPACLARLSLFAFVVAIFMGHENGDKQRPAKRRHVQGMLDETGPLIKSVDPAVYKLKESSFPVTFCTGDVIK